MAYQPKSYRKFVATAATATLVASAVAPAAAAGFSDVSDRYAEAVNYLVENNITSGLTESTFGVQKEVKRGDAAVLLAKALGLDGEKSPASGFSDVPARAQKAVNALKEAGIFNGKTTKNFGFEDSMTRGEMALVIAKAYELSGDVTLKFTDVGDRYTQAVQALVENKITSGKTETSFGTSAKITRGEFAIFLHKAETLGEDVVVGDLEVVSVSAITSTGVTVDIKAPTEDLVDQTVVVKDGAGKAYAVNAATIKAGATEATFNFVTPLTVSPTSAWTVNGVAYKVDKLEIVAVESTDSENKTLVVEFNSPVSSLDASEITIREKVAQTRSAVDSVKLAKDGMSAQITLVGFGDARIAGLKDQTVYTFSMTKNGKVTSADFEIPAVYEDAVVKSINPLTRTVQVNEKDASGNYTGVRSVTVPESIAFDFNEALGRDLTIWVDKNNKMTKFAYNEETVIFDAVEYETKTIGGSPVTVVKTVTDGKTYQISTGGAVGVQSTNNSALDQTVGNKDNYAKVVLGTDGKAKSIIAHDLNNTILVDKNENQTVSGYGLAASLKDYTILKDGKTVTVADIKAGDVVYYNTSTKVAEVYNKTVSGKISAFFNNEIQLDGKSYLITGAQGVINGNFTALSNSNVSAYTNVTAYLNRAGELKLLTGERTEAASATSVALVRENISLFDYKGTDYLKVVTQKKDGSSVTEEVDATKLKTVKGITVGGKSTFQTASLTPAQVSAGTFQEVAGFFTANYADDAGTEVRLFAAVDGETISAALAEVEGANDGVALTKAIEISEISAGTTKESLLEVTKADNVVTGLNFLTGTAVDNASNEIKLTDKALGTSNGTGPSYQLNSSVPVFIKDTLAAGQTTQTYTSTTWGALDPNISKILENNAGGSGLVFDVYNDGNGNAKYIFLDQGLIQAPDANKKFEGIISEVKYGTQSTPQIAYIKFAGDDTQYTVGQETGLHTTSLVVGEVLNVEAKDKQVVTFTQETTNTTNKVGKYSATDTQIADGEFSIAGTGGYELANAGAKVYEVVGTGLNQKLEERTYADLANLKSNQYIEASLIAANSKKVDAIVIRTDVTAPTLSTAAFTGATQLTLTFSEAVTATSASFTDGKIATPTGTFTVSSVAGSGTNTLVLVVSATDTITGTTTGTVDVSADVKDLFGNAITVLDDKAITAGGF